MNIFRDIVFISSIRWDFSWHRQQEIMSMLSDRGFRVLFVQPSKNRQIGEEMPQEVRKNVWLVTPKGLPYERCLATVHWFNARLADACIKKAMNILDFSDPIIWFDRIHGVLSGKYLKQYRTVYDLIDEILAFGRLRNNKLLIGLENRVLRNTDLLISSSNTLLERKLNQSGRNGKNLFVPNGVDTRRFTNTNQSVLRDNDHKPIIGFVGDIAKRSINYQLVEAVAEMNPEWNFVFVGPGDSIKEHLRAHGIIVKDAVNGDAIPGVIADFSVGIIPYQHNSRDMDYVFPRKALEYLAAGKPVVSTDMLELRGMQPHVTIADNPKDFSRCIELALTMLLNDDIEKRRRFAQQFDWDVLLKKVIDGIEMR